MNRESERLFFIVLVVGVLAAVSGAAAFAATSKSATGPAFEESVQPFLEAHCTFCHNAQLKTADLELDRYRDSTSATEDTQVWQRVKRMLVAKKMPPAGRPRPPAAEVTAVLNWIDAQAAPEETEPNPGRVTARRLNRAEYDNTVRDLLGVDLRPAKDFPVDDTGYGFDNIGDVLSISPILMEKYVAAADKLSRRAIMTNRRVKSTVARYSAPRDADERQQIGAAGRVPYSPEGRLTVRHKFPATGEYELELRFVDRRRIPPRRPEWEHRVPQLVEKTAAVEVETFDRKKVEQELGISRRDSYRFMRKFDARREGETLVIDRDELLAQLEKHAEWVKENPEPPEPPPPPALPVIFTLDGEELARYTAQRGEDGDYDDKPEPVRRRIEAGKHELHAEILSPQGRPWDPNERDWNQYRYANTETAKRMVFADYIEITGPYDPEPAPLPESHRRIMVCEPSGSAFDRACAQQIIARLLRLAFRQPVSRNEVDRYVHFARQAVKDGESFERGIQLALKAILISPQFLFRIERDPEGVKPGETYRINDFELASRLSYFLWSSMPDEELLAAAENGDLSTLEGRKAQVMRMIQDPKAGAFVKNFAGQWLQLRNISLAKPDPVIFPEFDEALREAMVRETELFFEHLIREDRSILEFLNSDYTFLNERLARHYGIAGVEGPEFRKVAVPGEQRGGVLTNASVLTVSSYPTRTSPVLRGLWVLENILGDRPPDPPAGVPELDEDTVGKAASLRQELERHRADPGCAVCHDRMDPLGFGLENYNAIGAWRTTDGKFPIDASGELPGGLRFSGPADLKSILYNRSDQFSRNLTEKMLTYALGRGLESYDKKAVEEINKSLSQNGYRFSSLLLGIVESTPFQMRRVGGSS